MPSLSYSSDGSNLSPVTPHYSSKFMDNSPSSLDPNASVYQPLKKWLWHPHCCQTEHCLFHWSSLFQVFFFFSWTAPESFLHSKVPHNQTPSAHNPSIHTCVWLRFKFYLEIIFLFFFFSRGCVVFLLRFGVLPVRLCNLLKSGEKDNTQIEGQMSRRAITSRRLFLVSARTFTAIFSSTVKGHPEFLFVSFFCQIELLFAMEAKDTILVQVCV